MGSRSTEVTEFTKVVAIHLKDKPLTPNGTKEGTDYDRCPVDGCIEVEKSWNTGGFSRKGGERRDEYKMWEVYHADPRKGGCGTPWTRTTRQGLQMRQAQGKPVGMLTRAAAANRVVSVPSEAFKRGYEQIDWSK